MATISSVVSKLTLDTSQFNTRLQRSKRRAKTWGKDISRVGRNVGKAVAAGTAVAAVGIAYMTAKQLESIDASAKFARSIDLQVDRLAGLRLAGDLNGVSNEQLDKSLQKMVRSIGDANTMGGSLSRTFDDLGVSSEDLAKKSPDEQLALLADAFAKVEDRTTAASMASAIFGRQGTAMLNVLDQGSAGLALAQEKAEKFGVAFNAIDARVVEEANDQIALMKLRLEGVQQQITIGLAPYLASISEQINEIEVNSVDASDVIGDSIAKVGDALSGFADVFDSMDVARQFFVTGLQGGLTVIMMALEKVGEAVESITSALGFDYEAPEWIGRFADEMDRATTESDAKLRASFDALFNDPNSEKITDFFDEIEDGAQRVRESTEQVRESVEQVAESNPFSEEVGKTLGELQRQLDTFGMNDMQIKLFDLESLGVGETALEQIKKTMTDIRRLEDQRDRSDSIASIVENLERQVRLFGVTADQQAILELESLGAGDDIVAQAKAAIEQRLDLEANLDLTRRVESSSGPSLVRAGGAQAQAAAFAAQRQMNPQLDETKKQTGLLGRVADKLDDIEERAGRSIFGGGLEEVGIQ